MTRYVIGDVQGCFGPLMRLLKRLRFDPQRDRLWFAGDLVNRGGQSLEVLRFVVEHQYACRAVLGNHDLHLLAHAAGLVDRPEKELARVVDAPDAPELIDWLRRQKLLKVFRKHSVLLSHAGVHPGWSVSKARALADEVEQGLRGRSWEKHLSRSYGGKIGWDGTLEGSKRLKAITANLTRMRYLSGDGSFDSVNKGPPGTQGEGLFPWFSLPSVRPARWRVLFGHWATLGYLSTPQAVCLDSGCVWGGRLTAVKLKEPDKPIQV
ncbi:MAG: symmetrical bis(5'-nucleosyl)-tetraphosphatase [Pseudomonadota bacterium]